MVKLGGLVPPRGLLREWLSREICLAFVIGERVYIYNARGTLGIRVGTHVYVTRLCII